MYFVVFCEDWCSTVPESWVDGSTKIFKWPPKNENATTACKKAMNPKSNWLQKKYTRLLGPYKTFDVARQVEMAAVNLSTSDETSFVNIDNKEKNPPKRERKVPLRYQKSEESSDDNEEEEDNNHSNKSLHPENKFYYKSTKVAADADDYLLETQLFDYGSFFGDSEYSHLNDDEENNKKISVISVETVAQPDIASKDNMLNEAINLNDDEFSVVINNNYGTQPGSEGQKQNTAKRLDAPVCQCCPACQLKLDQMSRKLDTILLVVNSKEIPNSTQMSSSLVLNVLPEFPLKNIESLTQFNQLLLNNKEAHTQYTKVIELRKGADAKKHVRDVLSFILDNNFSCKLSWSVQKQTISVKEMNFVNILTSTIIKFNPRCTLSELNDAIKSWLQHASDRVKYANEKHHEPNKD